MQLYLILIKALEIYMDEWIMDDVLYGRDE